uniref:DUF2971 domain-containing protein n=1 Tax=Caulobacter sp. (strain K31) TaxID=366602 RepID=B0T314_CAUSK
MTEEEAITAFADLVFPYSTRRFREVEEQGLKMAHYTTAESAALILKNRTLWLRNAQLMNDSSEVAHGSACLEAALHAGLGLRLENALNASHPGLFKAVAERVSAVDAQTRLQTYISSLSAHEPNNMLGRLSMWRAYGGQTAGVALIFNTEMFSIDSARLGIYSSPISYGTSDDLAVHLMEVIENIEKNKEILDNVPFESAKNILFNVLQFAALSHKHPAFEEEQEWRIIHSPLTEATAFISTSIQTVRGIPQMVCEIPLRDQPGLNAPWMNLDRLLDRIIIGPCAYPLQVAWAFREILRELGVPNPDSRVSIASIPLRQQG